MLFISDHFAPAFCDDCEYYDTYYDFEEFWGDRSVPRITRDCAYCGFCPEDENCPRHDDYMQETSEEEEDGEGEENEEA